METKKKNHDALQEFAYSAGALAFGVCDIREVKKSFPLSAAAREGLDYAVCVAVGLSKKILEGIVDKPTKLYFHHYRQANNLLDHISMRITGYLQSSGYQALPIPASQIVDWQKQTAHLSHKRLAELAGIGWLGRNNLIVHPRYGAQMRLTTVLTDMPLAVDTKLARGCSDCRECVTVCPAGAIKDSQSDFDHHACFEKLKLFQKERLVDQYICGVCVKACLPDFARPRGKAGCGKAT